MHITLGIDVGTTTITALALDARSGEVVGRATTCNDAQTTTSADKARGRSQWDVDKILRRACEVLCNVVARLGARRSEVAGIGLTGQQHGVVIVDSRLKPLTPFINWQDRRGEDLLPCGLTYVEQSQRLVGSKAPCRAGCALSAGFMGVTLFWMKQTGVLPATGKAVFISDYVGSRLTGEMPVTDPTNAASSGLFHIKKRDWDAETIRALGLPQSLFPPVREAGDHLGGLCPMMARHIGLTPGTPVFVSLGDNQASFVGSVAQPETTVLVNVGTGAQVSMFTRRIHYSPPLETRPFPRSGYLLVYAGLCGGRSYAILERFFRDVGTQVLGLKRKTNLYAAMNALVQKAPRGADGLRCEPYFAGSRAEPNRRATWTGVSESNFTPAHMIRALLEGMARSFREGYDRIHTVAGHTCQRLVGAGNGLRQNLALARIVSDEFAMPLYVPVHREEAAYGAALIAGYGAGLWPNLAAAGQVIRYQQIS